MKIEDNKKPNFPPLFRGKSLPLKTTTFSKAIEEAKKNIDPGLIIYNEDFGELNASLILAPDIKLKEALGMVLVKQMGVADSLGSLGPPELAIHFNWPNRIKVNGANCGYTFYKAATKLEEEIPDEAKEYDANVWAVGNYIIKAVLNYDPLGEKPYAKTSFIKCPGAFWGKGIPEIIEDLQNICNAAARALVNNMGISSGPQVEVNLERIPPNEDITQLHPWKIWQVTNDPLGSSAPAVRFTQPDDNANTLLGVYDKFSKLADDQSGIPSYVYGDLNVQGAGRTSSGLSMLMGAAGKGIRQVVMHIDNEIIKPIVYRQFVYNMRYD